MEPWDIKIVKATVVDGTGNPRHTADIGIRDGRIAALGVVPGRARHRIEAEGLVACPGFVDVHTHTDGLVGYPTADNMLRQGVTTVVSGNCGSSAWPVGAMLEKVDAAQPAINYATLIGHGTLRDTVMGKANRKPTKAELTRMRRLAAQGMREGAVGISTGLFYVPGAYARLDELVAVSQVVGEYNGIYASHTRSAGGKMPQAIKETADIGRLAGLPVHVSHLKVLHRRGRTTRRRAAEILELIARLRDKASDLTYDLHPFPATNTNLASVALPPWVASGGLLNKRLRSEALRRRISPAVQGNIAWIGGPHCITVVVFKPDPSLEGLTLADIARRRDRPAVETAMDLVLEGDPSCIFHALRDEDVALFLRGDLSMIASDGKIIPHHRSPAHPRNYGTFPRVLREAVRERRHLSLEDAIRRMTAYPALRFRIPGRGMLLPGHAADIVLFDPAKIAEQTTFENPHAFPVGMQAVLVNGRIAWKAGSDRIARAGRALRRA